MDESLSRFAWAYEKFLQLVAIVFVVSLLMYMFGILPPDAWRFETFALVVIFLLGYSSDIKKNLSNNKMISVISGMIFLVAGLSSCIYLFSEIPRLEWAFGSVWTNADIMFGTMMIVALLDLTRRKFGWPLPIVALIFLSYALFGHTLPSGFFQHSGFGFDMIISFLFGPGGVFGIVFTTFVTIIFIFLLFGVFLEKTGVGKVLIDLSLATAGKWRGGPAKVAVVASAVLGSINGNSVANVATTGPMTIPLMKRTGFSPSFAGGVESAASTGGQFLPPVMGAGAFIMAEFLQIPYQTVIIAAILPALLYFLATFLVIDLEAVKQNLQGIVKRPSIKSVLKKTYLVLPIIVLVYALLVENLPVARSGFYAIVACVIVSWFTKENRMGIMRISRSMVNGTNAAINIGAMCATAGIVVGTVSMTGFGNQFSSVIINLAGENVFLVGVFVALISIVLGMGLPTTAAYIIAMSVAVPALVALDVPPLSAHLFVFYFAVLSAITPPIGAAFYTGASIAEAPVMRTGFQATRIAIAGFTIPFFFVINPALLLDADIFQISIALGTSIIGILAVAMAAQGVTFRGTKLYYWQCILLGISFILLIYPGVFTDVFGFVLFLISFLLHPKWGNKLNLFKSREDKRLKEKGDGENIEQTYKY